MMKNSTLKKPISCLVATAALVAFTVPAWAGTIFLTGHDPDFHSTLGGNTTGARNINTSAIDYIMETGFNTFVDNGINRFLFVEAMIPPPNGHTVGVNGIVASGYTAGVDFEHHDASTLDVELARLGTYYSGIVVASDFGGLLTQAELDILNTNSTEIIDFLNDGGGLYAMAESNLGSGLTPNGGHYGYLPFVVSSTALNQSEVGNSVTAFGTSLGLANSDVNGNASHNVFTGTGGLDIVDIDSAGRILSIAGRGQIDPETGINVPDGGTTAALLGLSLLGMAGLKRKLPKS